MKIISKDRSTALEVGYDITESDTKWTLWVKAVDGKELQWSQFAMGIIQTLESMMLAHSTVPKKEVHAMFNGLLVTYMEGKDVTRAPSKFKMKP